MNRCPYWDCGWCYAPSDLTNAPGSVEGKCPGTEFCDYYKELPLIASDIGGSTIDIGDDEDG